MSLGSPLARRNANLAVPTPVYADANDSPIDLRKKVAIRRQRRFEYGYSDDEEEEDEEDSARPLIAHHSSRVSEGAWNETSKGYLPIAPTNPYLLSIRNLHPLLSEQYGIQYALFASPEGTHVVPVPYSQFVPSSFLLDPKLRRPASRDPVLSPTYDREGLLHQKQNENHHPASKYYHSHDRDHYKSMEDKLPQTSLTAQEVKRPCLLNNWWLKRRNSSVFDETSSGDNNIEQERSNKTNIRRGRLRFRSNSFSAGCAVQHKSDGKRLRKRKYIIHSGYDSDTDTVLSQASRNQGVERKKYLRSNSEASEQFHKTKIVDGKHDVTSKKDYTLLNLLVGSAKDIRSSNSVMKEGKSIDVLLQQLQKPANHSARKEYQWSVYEYYNHLVERSSRHPHPRSFVAPAPMDRSSFPEEDCANLQRKRPSRALTGKHVKHGTGASPSTLITLRQKIQERQKAREFRLMHSPSQSLNKLISSKNAIPKKPKLGSFPKRIKQSPPPSLCHSSSKLKSPCCT